MEILIIGGGIAGLATALAAQRAGLVPTVAEAEGEAVGREQGVFLTLAVNGLGALRAIGAEEAVADLGFETGAIRFASGRGQELGRLPLGPRLPDGRTARTIRRSDLAGALLGLARERGIAVHHGLRLTDAREADGRIEAHFADGSTRATDLLVGADGVGSRVRTLIDPAAPAPRYAGLLNAGGFARVPGLGWAGGEYTMTWGHRCFFGHTVAPDGEVWWFANPPARQERSRDELRARSTEEVRAELLGLLEGDAGPAAEIVAASPGPLALWNAYDLPSIPHWHRGRSVLVGDAAHGVSPSTGQGAALAIEDAVELAHALTGLGREADPTAALDRYVAARRPRVERIAAWGRRTGNTKTVGPVARRLTDAIMPPILRMAGSPKAQAKQAWIFEHAVPELRAPAPR